MAGTSASCRLSSLCRHLSRAPAAAPAAAAAGRNPKVGIVGLGGRGTNTLTILEETAGLQEKMTVVALADVDAEALEPHKDKGYALFATASELIQSGLIDTLLIVTPHYYHTTIGAEAFAAGLHVLTEKPISVHKADCEKLIAAYDARPNKEQKFAAMFNNRQRSLLPPPSLPSLCLLLSHRGAHPTGNNPTYQKVREMVANGELGEIKRVNWIITTWLRTDAYYVRPSPSL